MGLRLGLIANVVWSFYELKWLELCPKNLNHFFTEDRLMTFLFYLNRLNASGDFTIFNTCHRNMCFSFEEEQKFSFLDIEVSLEKVILVTTVNRKLTFSGV